MKLILAGFEGNANSSKILLDYINNDCKKIYLPNDTINSVNILANSLDNTDLIIAVGQKPLIKDKLCIELQAKKDNKTLNTIFPVKQLEDIIKPLYEVSYSNNAGTSYCNNLYYHILKLIEEKDLKAKMVFIHIPFLKNIMLFNNLVYTFELITNSSKY